MMDDGNGYAIKLIGNREKLNRENFSLTPLFN